MLFAGYGDIIYLMTTTTTTTTRVFVVSCRLSMLLGAHSQFYSRLGCWDAARAARGLLLLSLQLNCHPCLL